MGIIHKIKDFFYDGPVKNVPDGHRHCPACEGNGLYDVFIDCLYCDGQGYLPNEELKKVLLDLEKRSI